MAWFDERSQSSIQNGPDQGHEATRGEEKKTEEWEYLASNPFKVSYS